MSTDCGEKRRSKVLFLLLLLAFVAVHGGELRELQHSIDEGVNVVAARRIQEGERPYLDFIYHQLPTYLFTLALLPTDHLWYGRALSLAFLAASGGLVFLLAGRLDAGAGPIACAAFYFAAMQYYGLLALPNAAMLAFALLGVWLTLYVSPARPASGGICLAVSVLYKPLTVAVLAAVSLTLAVSRRRRPQLAPFVLSAGVSGLVAWIVFHWASDGAFTDLLWQQLGRYSGRSGLDLLREGVPSIRADLEGLSPLGLNLLFTASAYASGDALLIPFALLGVGKLWRSESAISLEDKLLWTAWLVLALGFSLFLWDLSWEHYHLLDLPPLCLLAGYWAAGFMLERPVRRLAVLLVCLGYAAAGTSVIRHRHRDYAPVVALRGGTAPLLAFDPTVNVIARAELACDVQDFFTQRLPGFLGEAFARFHVTSGDIVRCLEREPETRIVIHQLSDTALYFIDDELAAYIARQPASRVIYLGEDARAAFDALR